MKKKILQPILNFLWKIQFKKIKFDGPRNYHCRDCKAGFDFYCGDFCCPIEEEPQTMLTYRFKNKTYQNLLIKWKTLIS